MPADKLSPSVEEAVRRAANYIDGLTGDDILGLAQWRLTKLALRVVEIERERTAKVRRCRSVGRSRLARCKLSSAELRGLVEGE